MWIEPPKSVADSCKSASSSTVQFPEPDFQMLINQLGTQQLGIHNNWMREGLSHAHMNVIFFFTFGSIRIISTNRLSQTTVD